MSKTGSSHAIQIIGFNKRVVGHHKEISVLALRELALRNNDRSDEGLRLESSALESLCGG